MIPSVAFAEEGEADEVNESIGHKGQGVDEAADNSADWGADGATPLIGEQGILEGFSTDSIIDESRALAEDAEVNLLATYDGAGLEGDPYVISTGTEFYEFAQDFNAGLVAQDSYITLDDNIDLSGYFWTPIGLWPSRSFQGHFDGADHTISGLTINEVYVGNSSTYACYGLFSFMSKGEIKNLSIAGASIWVEDSTHQGTGGAGILVGLIAPDESANVSIANCTVIGSSVTALGGAHVLASGLIGSVLIAQNPASGASVSLENNAVSVVVKAAGATGESHAAGVVAYAVSKYANSAIDLENCSASGLIEVSHDGAEKGVFNAAGGLVGLASIYGYGQGNVQFTITNSQNSASVSSVGAVEKEYVGGLVGAVEVPEGSFRLENNTISGILSASGASERNGVGGAVGFAYVAMPYTATNFTAVGVSVEASIIQAASTNAMANNAGGLIGLLNADNESRIEVIECAVETSVSVNADGGARQATAGGLIGLTTTIRSPLIFILDSSSRASVTSRRADENYAGGLLGSMEALTSFYSNESSIDIGDCFASGPVDADGSGTHNAAGGLFGLALMEAEAFLSISSSYAVGSVTSTGSAENCAGGFGGDVSTKSEDLFTITNCYALGDSLASGAGTYNSAGGFIGSIRAGVFQGTAGHVLISNVYAAGQVSSSGASMVRNESGGLIGSFDAFAPSQASLSNSVAVNQAVLAQGGTDNRAGRLIGTEGAADPSTLDLSQNFAWKNMKVNNVTVDDSNLNGVGVYGAVLLARDFWTNINNGPDFDTLLTWDIADGRLPLLYDPRGVEYAPSYLANDPVPPTPDPTPDPAPDPTPNPVPAPQSLSKTGDQVLMPLAVSVLALLLLISGGCVAAMNPTRLAHASRSKDSSDLSGLSHFNKEE